MHTSASGSKMTSSGSTSADLLYQEFLTHAPAQVAVFFNTLDALEKQELMRYVKYTSRGILFKDILGTPICLMNKQNICVYSDEIIPGTRENYNDETYFTPESLVVYAAEHHLVLPNTELWSTLCRLMPARDYKAGSTISSSVSQLHHVLGTPFGGCVQGGQRYGVGMYSYLGTGEITEDAYGYWHHVLRANKDSGTSGHARPSFLLPGRVLVSASLSPITKYDAATEQDNLITCMVSSGLRKDPTYAQKDLQAELDGGEVRFVIKDKEQIVGFVSGGPRLFHDRRGEFELFHIGVDPDRRNEKIGGILFDHLLDYAKKYYTAKGTFLRKFWLTTNKDNHGSHEFYKKKKMSVSGASVERFGPQKVEVEYALIFEASGNSVSVNALGKDIYELLCTQDEDHVERHD